MGVAAKVDMARHAAQVLDLYREIATARPRTAAASLQASCEVPVPAFRVRSDNS
jgi:hypothetical protein